MHVDEPACRRRHPGTPRWSRIVVLGLAFGAGSALGQGLAAKAKESGCVDTPRVVEGATYRCTTSSGAAAYFNVPEPNGDRPTRRSASGGGAPVPASTPVPGLPRVDAATQKGRDDLRRKVLQDELAAEERLLVESRAAFAGGAPPALPEEQSQPQRYAERIARLRQAVQLHERNVELLRRELGLAR